MVLGGPVATPGGLRASRLGRFGPGAGGRDVLASPKRQKRGRADRIGTRNGRAGPGFADPESAAVGPIHVRVRPAVRVWKLCPWATSGWRGVRALGSRRPERAIWSIFSKSVPIVP